jgi:hypothetical protein
MILVLAPVSVSKEIHLDSSCDAASYGAQTVEVIGCLAKYDDEGFSIVRSVKRRLSRDLRDFDVAIEYRQRCCSSRPYHVGALLSLCVVAPTVEIALSLPSFVPFWWHTGEYDISSLDVEKAA